MYTVVVNPNENRVCIPHPDVTVPEIMLGPYAAAAIDPSVWNDDVDAFREALEDKAIELVEADGRPVKIPKPPDNIPQQPLHAYAVKQIVFLQDDKRALEYIRMNPVYEHEAGAPADVSYLQKNFLPVLHAAQTWLESWGRRDRRSRIRAIKKRIAEIKLM